MHVLFISPGFPAEMSFFAAGLPRAGATVIGLGDQPPDALPREVRHALAHYLQVTDLGDTAAVVDVARDTARAVGVDRVECLWEPYMFLAAHLREVLGLPGMTMGQTVPFRDKEAMKRVLDEAGVRTPRHTSTTTVSGVYEAAERIGFPLIVKPISGAGAADTYRIDSRDGLAGVIPLVRHVPEVSVEEFVEAEEFTYDTICADGDILVENICWYRPRPLDTRVHEWISPVTVALRDLDAPDLAGGRAMGRAVLDVLGFREGFSHMEWYRKADGEVVFGEIGARPPGARMVDAMNFATDADLFAGWAHAVVRGALPEQVERRYNAAMIFKRARGAGRITAVEGLDELMRAYGDHVVALELLPVGAPRRDWRQLLISDGMVIVRHPDLATALEIADRFAAELHLYAG